MNLVHVGYDHYVDIDRVIAVASLLERNASLTKMKQRKGQEGKLVSLQSGRKARSILVTDCGIIILSALTPEAFASRVQKKERK